MTALECLFVEGRAFQKGAAIADVLSKLVTVQGFDRDSQIEWVMALYRRRIDAVHEGSSVTEDLDALRLVQITKSVVHWAVHHLTPYHRSPNGACLTFGEVFDAGRHLNP